MPPEASAFSPVLAPEFASLRHALARLRSAPPQVILLEGGTEEQRVAAARYWAAVLHCPQGEEAPCLSCGVCTQIGAGAHLDVLAYDGRISNREDEENPGPVRALTMENVRQLKARLRDAPHADARRVVMLYGLGLTRDEAANALLKALEEPSATTVFVLLAPQREQLLPTLVSRSWVVTLPWPDTDARDPATAGWEDALAGFLRDGTGWLDRTSARGALSPALAGHILLACQKSLGAVLRGGGTATPLARALGRLPLEAQCGAASLIARAQEALAANVSPARVLDWLAIRLFALTHP